MESGPAIFTGSVFALFGGGLLLWTAVRLRQRAPIAHEVNPVASAAVAGFAGMAAVFLAVWCFTRT
ncbi:MULTISPECIES: hypothetical protein [Streptomyces]|uniref:hypothetical protein n=1 Tax=unclassified Streptomyces TaxID=2593676 RepID=UPI001C2DFED5|nr:MULTISPECIES: hypothetical protein [Streptomyces]MBV1941614.1 hypothetical protein [Streptomyces sp. BV286]WAU78908.1 hypothetical protein O1Q96_03535 [Streptomyces aurantiacus]